jgi:hypothetical protein
MATMIMLVLMENVKNDVILWNEVSIFQTIIWNIWKIFAEIR